MARVPEIFVKVKIDPEAQQDLGEAMAQFRKAAEDLEHASDKVQHALRRLGDAFVLEKEERI